MATSSMHPNQVYEWVYSHEHFHKNQKKTYAHLHSRLLYRLFSCWNILDKQNWMNQKDLRPPFPLTLSSVLLFWQLDSSPCSPGVKSSELLNLWATSLTFCLILCINVSFQQEKHYVVSLMHVMLITSPRCASSSCRCHPEPFPVAVLWLSQKGTHDTVGRNSLTQFLFSLKSL